MLRLDGFGFGINLFTLFADLLDVSFGVSGFVNRSGDADYRGGRRCDLDLGLRLTAATGDRSNHQKRENKNGEIWDSHEFWDMQDLSLLVLCPNRSLSDCEVV